MKLFPRQIILRDPNTETEGGAPNEESIENQPEQSMEDLINEGLSQEPEEGIDTEVPESDDTSKEGEGEETPEKPAADDDPEIELDYEENGEKVKMKMSEIKASIKWIKENSQSIAGSMKVRELAIKNPEFGKLLNQVIESSVGENETINTEYVSNSLKALEVKSEKIEEKVEEKDADIEEAEAMLEELDPDSNQYLTLKKSIKIMKSQKETLKDALSKIDSITSKLDGMDQKNADAVKQTEETKMQEEINKAKKTFDNEYTSLIKDVEFIDDGEKQRFQNEVKKLVAGQSAKIANDDDYKKVISESVKIATKALEDYHEAVRVDYLKKKGKLPKDKPKEEITTPEGDLNQDSLEKELEKMLTEGEGKE